MAADCDGTAALERGHTARREKRFDDARIAFADAARCFRSAGQLADLAAARGYQAQIERDERRYDAALGFQLEALGIARVVGDKRRIGHVLRHVGDILGDAGRYEDAGPYFAEMMLLYRALPDVPPLELANAIRSAAVHKQQSGDIAEARNLWLQARDRYAALDELFRALTGSNRNPGVAEAERRLAELGT